MNDGNFVRASLLVVIALAHIRQIDAGYVFESSVVTVLVGEAGVDVPHRDFDRSDSLQPDHDGPGMISRIIADDYSVNAVFHVLEIGSTVGGIEVFTFKTEVIARAPDLAEKNQPKIKSAKSCNDAGTVGYWQLGLVGNVVEWRSVCIVAGVLEVQQ